LLAAILYHHQRDFPAMTKSRENGAVGCWPIAPLIFLRSDKLTTLSRKQAADLLGISIRTLDRWVKKGRIQAPKKIGEGQYAESVFTHSDLGLSEPEPKPKATPIPTIPEPEPEPEPSDVEIREQADRMFADAYLSGEATDSCGNRIDGTNKRFLYGSKSLIGISPQDRPQRQRRDTTGHMDPALIGPADALNAPRNPIDTDEYQELIYPGHMERKAAMYRDAGVRQPSAQEQRQALDRAAIHAAFRQGFVR
jgi:excisionase family DNA binding protein